MQAHRANNHRFPASLFRALRGPVASLPATARTVPHTSMHNIKAIRLTKLVGLNKRRSPCSIAHTMFVTMNAASNIAVNAVMMFSVAILLLHIAAHDSAHSRHGGLDTVSLIAPPPPLPATVDREQTTGSDPPRHVAKTRALAPKPEATHSGGEIMHDVPIVIDAAVKTATVGTQAQIRRAKAKFQRKTDSVKTQQVAYGGTGLRRASSPFGNPRVR